MRYSDFVRYHPVLQSNLTEAMRQPLSFSPFQDHSCLEYQSLSIMNAQRRLGRHRFKGVFSDIWLSKPGHANVLLLLATAFFHGQLFTEIQTQFAVARLADCYGDEVHRYRNRINEAKKKVNNLLSKPADFKRRPGMKSLATRRAEYLAALQVQSTALSHDDVVNLKSSLQQWLTDDMPLPCVHHCEARRRSETRHAIRFRTATPPSETPWLTTARQLMVPMMPPQPLMQAPVIDPNDDIDVGSVLREGFNLSGF
eukprot:m.208260 g.208260  ORF g.208260 m.208260 type:complete len:255 (+) comp17131_c0_seq1:207-971(+)